jgi:2Fe-2S ferredoxin
MTNITVVDRSGETHEIDAEDGVPLMHTLRELDYGVAAICMGICSCATCHIYVAEEWLERLGPREVSENEMLSALEHHRPNSRLSCQIECTGELEGLKLTLAPEE